MTVPIIQNLTSQLLDLIILSIICHLAGNIPSPAHHLPGLPSISLTNTVNIAYGVSILGKITVFIFGHVLSQKINGKSRKTLVVCIFSIKQKQLIL